MTPEAIKQAKKYVKCVTTREQVEFAIQLQKNSIKNCERNKPCLLQYGIDNSSQIDYAKEIIRLCEIKLTTFKDN